MQKVYFSNYKDLGFFPIVGKVAGIENEENYFNLSKVSDDKIDKMEIAAFHKEILKKYPYDGKSTFAELLAAEIKKSNSI